VHGLYNPSCSSHCGTESGHISYVVKHCGRDAETLEIVTVALAALPHNTPNGNECANDNVTHNVTRYAHVTLAVLAHIGSQEAIAIHQFVSNYRYLWIAVKVGAHLDPVPSHQRRPRLCGGVSSSSSACSSRIFCRISSSLRGARYFSIQ
jgi:hypothetical protein